jgi:cytoskeletal protein RodZ
VRIPFFESAEKKRERLLAKEEKLRTIERARIAKELANRDGWKQFWFNVRLTIAVSFLSLLGLIIAVSFLPRSAPTYTPPQTSRPIQSLASPAPSVPKESTTTPKPVHVKAYIKADGTHVDAHERNAPTKRKN